MSVNRQDLLQNYNNNVDNNINCKYDNVVAAPSSAKLKPIIEQMQQQYHLNLNNINNSYVPTLITDSNSVNLQVEVLNFLLKYLDYNQGQLSVIAKFQSNSLQDLDNLAKTSRESLDKLIADVNREINEKIEEAKRQARTGGILGFIFSLVSIIISLVEVFTAVVTGNFVIGVVGIMSLTDSVAKAVANMDIVINPEDALDENNIYFEMSSNGAFGAIGHLIGGKDGKNFGSIGENVFNMLSAFVNIINDIKAALATVGKVGLKASLKDIALVLAKLSDLLLRVVGMSLQIITANNNDTDNVNYYAMLSMGIIGAIMYSFQQILDNFGVDKKTSGLIINGMMLLSGLVMLYSYANQDATMRKTILSIITAIIATIVAALPLVLEQLGVDDYGIAQNIISMIGSSIGMMLLHAKLNQAHSEEMLSNLANMHEANNIAPENEKNMLKNLFEKVKMSFNETLNLKTQVNQTNSGILTLISTLYNSYMQQVQSLSGKEGSQIQLLNDKNDSSRQVLNKIFSVFSTSIEDYLNQIKFATRA